MARPKPTLLTIPQELRNKIYGYALELPDEFQVCECPGSLSNKMGFCDLIKEAAYLWNKSAQDTMNLTRGWAHPGEPRETCRARTLRNPKTSLLLLCKQSADELKDVKMRLPILVFCKWTCYNEFFRSSQLYPGHISRMDIWAVRIKSCVDPQYDVTGTLTNFYMAHLNDMYEDPQLGNDYALKVMSHNDTGYRPHSARVVEVYLENKDSCEDMAKAFARCKLHRGNYRIILKGEAEPNKQEATVKKDETDEQDKEEEPQIGSASGASTPLTKSAKRKRRQRAAKAKARPAADWEWTPPYDRW